MYTVLSNRTTFYILLVRLHSLSLFRYFCLSEASIRFRSHCTCEDANHFASSEAKSLLTMNPPSALQDLISLSAVHKAALKKSQLLLISLYANISLRLGNFKQLSDVILTPPSDVSKRLRVSLSEAQSIIENVCKELAKASLRVSNIGEITADDKFTTGDAYLDGVIGGGIRTSMVWEVSGER